MLAKCGRDYACRLAPSDSLVLTLASGALTLAHRLDEAGCLLDRALMLDNGSPWAWLRRAWASAYAGDAVSALPVKVSALSRSSTSRPRT